MVKLQQPEGSEPGHHPAHEQDKPVGRDFVAKTHALAQQDDYEPPSRESEVLDLTDIPQDTLHGPSSPRAERLARLAGKPFAAAGTVLGKVRDHLPAKD